MSEQVQPAEEQAKEMIRTWLTTHNHSLRNLALEAGVPPSIISKFLHGETKLEASSALKLYIVMQQGMSFPDRKSLLETLGLLPLATAFSRDALFTIDMHASSYEVGSRLMVAAFDRFDHAAFEEAIPIFQQAEDVWGRSSSQAAFAICMIAQMHLNLGDYHRAQVEVQYVQDIYSAVMDPATRAELCRIRHWLDYYQGNYEQSKQALRERIKIAEEGGIEAQKNPHFLGRIYYDLGCQCPSQTNADQLFQAAERCFDASYQIHLRWGDEHNRAFDLFRKAQARRMQRQWDDARKLREQARQMFSDHTIGGNIALLHFELEDAKLSVEEGKIDQPKRKLDDVLHGWEQVKYPKGIADSLNVLGDLAYSQGHLEEALEIYGASLCLYPYDKYPSTLQVWDAVRALQHAIFQQSGSKLYHETVQRIVILAEHRQGYFSYLHSIAADRNEEVDHILSVLQSPF